MHIRLSTWYVRQVELDQIPLKMLGTAKDGVEQELKKAKVALMATSGPLPSPTSLPDADIVIYDGHCRFCTNSVRRLHGLAGQRLAFLSLHDAEVAERFPQLTHEQMMEEMYVFDREGNAHGGAAAFRYLTRRLPWLWVLAPLLHIPFSLGCWKFLYRQVARRRYLWGKTDSCESGSCDVHFR